jgi:hypothetical protein
VPVLGVWIAIFNRAGARWKKLVAFALGLALPFAPVLWLFVRAPRQTWFNLVRYHAFYRSLYWPDTTRHDLEILTSWIDSGQALLLGLGAATGLIWVVRRSGWERAVKAEIYLCAALAGALAAEVGSAHPTFSRYFLVTVPFLAILAAAGWFAACRAFGTTRPLWPAIAVAALLALGLGRTLYDRREMDNWANYERVAAFIDRITPPGEPVLTVEPVYVLTRRIPPPGYELSYTHRVKLPPKEAALMHILHDGAVARQVQSGLFATVYTCDAGDIKDYGLKALYRQHVELEECDIFWDRVK